MTAALADGKPAPQGARPRAWTIAIALLVLAVAAWMAWKFLGAEKEEAPKRTVQRITVLRPPPPPPPPPKQEKPPEPPKVKEEVKIDPPKPAEQPKADAAPPPGPLGVDAQGTGPGDGFGLAGRPGGRDIVLGGGGGGGATNALANATFASGVARHVAQELARDAKLRASEYRVVLHVWINRDGRVERHQIVTGSGNAEVDAWVTEGMARIGSLRQPVPEGLPHPLRIRVT